MNDTAGAAEHSLNYGCVVINDRPCLMKTTIVATGVGRSGTTMLARVMAAVGVDMGKNLTPETWEDKGLQVAVKNGDDAVFEEICRRYDLRRKKWGFKCPPIRSRLLRYNSLMRNPRYIIVFRDLLAVAVRNQSATGAELVKTMREAALSYVSMIEQLESLKQPVLLISYEKALQHPKHMVKLFTEYCGQSLSPERMEEIAAECILNADPRYFKK